LQSFHENALLAGRNRLYEEVYERGRKFLCWQVKALTEKCSHRFPKAILGLVTGVFGQFLNDFSGERAGGL
jgi:hypothetical protein